MPRLVEELFLQATEPSLGCADQVLHRWISLAHLFKHFFCRDAPIHQPNALGFAVLGFNLVEKLLERAAVLGVARQYFVSQRKALRRDDQRNHHLPTIAALVATIAKTPLVVLVVGGIGLEICA